MVKVINRNGQPVTLYNPAEKGEIYAFELKQSYSTKTGDGLTRAQRAYRSGYLDARKDNGKAYKHNEKKKAEKKAKRSKRKPSKTSSQVSLF